MGGLSCVATWEIITGADMTWVVCRRWAADISQLITLKSPPWIGGGGGTSYTCRLRTAHNSIAGTDLFGIELSLIGILFRQLP